ncbi:superinfection immunity protein [Stutzerimonas chloritidismutans]
MSRSVQPGSTAATSRPPPTARWEASAAYSAEPWNGPSRSLHPIIIINLFLGWTVAGWVFALVWACKKTTLHVSGDAQNV